MDFEKVKEIIVETLSCDADKVTPDADVYKRQRHEALEDLADELQDRLDELE